MCIRVLIADDQLRARRSLQALFTALRWTDSNPNVTLGATRNGQLELIGEATDGEQMITQVEALRPDVVVMELHLPKLNSLSVIRTIKRCWPAVRIVVLTMYTTDRAAVLAAGADAFLLKGCPTRELLDAVMPNPRPETA
jgi:DNA-binding NarL/FixJ family response regulator